MSSTPEKAQAMIKKLSVLAVILFALASVYQAEESNLIDLDLPKTTPNIVGVYYRVTRVTDGDTIHIDMNGNDETIRLLGINTPETVDPRRPVECFGKEASDYMHDLLKGAIVKLEYDPSQSYRDAYDRILAYVYLEDGQMVNRKMIADGYAYEYTYMIPYKYQKEFRDLQRLAQASHRGLWSESTCNGSKNIVTQ